MRLLVDCETNQDTLAASCYCLSYCNDYMNGEYNPHYPLPVPLTMVDDRGRFHSVARWFENFDGFWNDGPQGRGFSL